MQIVRETAKTTKRPAHKPRPDLLKGDLFGDIAKDRQKKAIKDEADRKRQQQQQQEQFRRDQVAKAQEHDWFKALKPNSVAYRFAVTMLETFVVIKPKGNQKRTVAAELEALSRMSDKDLVHGTKAVEHGRRVARKALAWAYDELTNKVETPAQIEPEFSSDAPELTLVASA
ncbi:MAG TPA: hypothetical protein VG992_00020 [Candidatus Saccharimonadales bacterium]|nr:hypothetical protein [Candidatus Saccharimonadales bacterium]